MATKAARTRATWEDAALREERIPVRVRRMRKARDDRFNRDAAHATPENGPNSLLTDPAYHMARACGWDVMRKELRRPEPPTHSNATPNAHYDPSLYLRNPDGTEFVVASANCPTWLWWKGLTPAERHALYEVSHEGEPPSAVAVFNMGLEISNPAFVVESW